MWDLHLCEFPRYVEQGGTVDRHRVVGAIWVRLWSWGGHARNRQEHDQHESVCLVTCWGLRQHILSVRRLVLQSTRDYEDKRWAVAPPRHFSQPERRHVVP